MVADVPVGLIPGRAVCARCLQYDTTLGMKMRKTRDLLVELFQHHLTLMLKGVFSLKLPSAHI